MKLASTYFFNSIHIFILLIPSTYKKTSNENIKKCIEYNLIFYIALDQIGNELQNYWLKALIRFLRTFLDWVSHGFCNLIPKALFG